jgi:single-strand DNA-binding protein
MRCINQITLRGRLGANPETKKFGDNKITKLTLAVTRSWKENNEWKDEVTWVNVDAWNKVGEGIASAVKGDFIQVYGRLSIRSYESGGEKKYATEVVAEDAVIVQSNKASEPQRSAGVNVQPSDNDEIPF